MLLCSQECLLEGLCWLELIVLACSCLAAVGF